MNPPPRRPDDEPTPLSDLPVAEPVGPDPDADGGYADLPVAVPVRPPAGRRREQRPRPPARRDPEPRDDGPPRPRVFAACGVIGCLGLGLVAAVGVLAYGAVLILSHLGERAAAPDPPGTAPVPVAREPVAPAVPAVREPHGPIAPTRLASPSATVDIGGAADAVVRAGGGRYLLFRLRGQNRVVAFDANSGAMVPGWEIKLEEPGALVAGGADHLWAYLPLARELVRYDLQTGRADRRAAVAAVDEVEAIAAGAGSDGPVYLAGPHTGGTRVREWHGATLRPGGASDHDRPLGEWLRARASDDGGVLTLAGRDGVAVGRRTRGRFDFALLKTWDGFSPVFAAPAPDGRWVYTMQGVYAPDGRLVLKPPAGTPFFTFPAADGGEFFVSQEFRDRDPVGPPRAHRAGDRNYAGPLKEVKSPLTWSDLVGSDAIPPNERVFFWPGAGLAATLPGNTTLQLQKVNVAALRAARGD